MNFVFGFKPTNAGVLTGCRSPVFNALHALCAAIPAQRTGRPHKYSRSMELMVLLMKLRHNLSYRALELITGVDAVTASRIVRRLTHALGEATVTHDNAPHYFIVDCTTVRIGTSDGRYYSGYKHYRGIKTQILCDDRRWIHDVSPPCPARMHDKTLWNRTIRRLGSEMNRVTLADKAYAGAIGENTLIIRPVKRQERAYRHHRHQAKQINRQLSRLRVRVEHVIASLKRFRIIRDRFPLAMPIFHGCMKTIAVIHNLEILWRNDRDRFKMLYPGCCNVVREL